MYTREIRRIASVLAVLLALVFALPAYAAPEDYDSSQPSVLR